MIKTGEKIFNHDIYDHNSIKINLEENIKKIIFCFPRANTSGCNLEAQEFEILSRSFKKENYILYGLCADPPKKVKIMSDQCNLSYTLLSDEKEGLLRFLGVIGIKKMYGKEYEGIIRSTIVCDKENIVTHVFEKVSPKGHAQKVADILGIK